MNVASMNAVFLPWQSDTGAVAGRTGHKTACTPNLCCSYSVDIPEKQNHPQTAQAAQHASVSGKIRHPKSVSYAALSPPASKAARSVCRKPTGSLQMQIR